MHGSPQSPQLPLVRRGSNFVAVDSDSNDTVIPTTALKATNHGKCIVG